MSYIQVIPTAYKRSEMLYTYIKKKQEENQKIVIVCSEARKANYLKKLMCFWSTKSILAYEYQRHKYIKINLKKFYTEDSMIMFTTNEIVNYINLVQEKIFESTCTFIQYDPAIDLEKFLRLFDKCQNENYSFTSFLRSEEIPLFLSKLMKRPNEKYKEIKEISLNKYQIVDIMAQDPAEQAVLQGQLGGSSGASHSVNKADLKKKKKKVQLETERAEIVRELEAARATLNKSHQEKAYSGLKNSMKEEVFVQGDKSWKVKASTEVRKYLNRVHEMRPIGIREEIIESCIRRFENEPKNIEIKLTQEQMLAIERYNRSLTAVTRYEQYLKSVKWWNPFTWRRFDL